MVKNCKVLFYNPHSNVLAFKYDDVDVQITISEKLDKFVKIVKIKFNDGNYYLTDEDETLEEMKSTKKNSKEIESVVKEKHVSTRDVENVL